MTKIGIVFNPFAGKNKHNPEKRKQKLERILGTHGVIRETKTIQEISEVAREFRAMNISVLGISGGDGTNQCVLTAFKDVYQDQPLPSVLFLKGGTMNLREASMKMTGSPEKRLKKLIHMVDQGDIPTTEHTLLCVNGKYGCIFGNGTIANFMEEYYDGTPGFKQALYMVARSVVSAITDQRYLTHLFRTIKATVKVGNYTLPQENFTALMAATTKECGLGFKPFYRAQEKTGYLHFLAVNLSPTEVIKNLPRFRLGKKIRSEKVYDVVTKEVVIQTHEPYYYTIDGEMLNSSKKLVITAGPTVQLLTV